MPKFMITETIHSEKVITARLGTNTVANNGGLSSKDTGKIVKLLGESRYGLAAVGNKIEGFVTSLNVGTVDGYAIGGVCSSGYKEVTFDGLEGTPGTGTVAVGDYVVTGTVVAAGTALSGPVKVCKATTQTNTGFAWRVVSLGSAGTGAVGTVGVIESV